MKAFRLGLLTTFLGSSAFAAPVIPQELADLAGSYHALLYTQAGDAGSPTALVTIALTNKGALTGKLTTEENKTYAFKTTLTYAATEEPEAGEPAGVATHPVISIVRGKNLPNWNLSLKINDFEGDDTFEADLNLGDENNAETANGFKLLTLAKGASPYAAAGVYTAGFELADEPGQNDPGGSGYATATIDANGLLKLVGKTGDGTAITASLPAGPGYRYLAFLNPYKRINSLFAGEFALAARTSGGFHAVPAATGYDFQWKKSSLLPKTTDKSYRAGFGPLDVLLTMEPWVAPGKGITVGASLGIDTTEVFTIAYGGVFPGSAYTKYIPVKAGFTDKNTLRIATGGAGSSAGANQDLWAKIITAKIDPKAGKFSALLNIEDTIMVSSKPKIIKRKVVFEGIFLQLEEGNQSSFVVGQIIVPPLDPKTGTTTSSAFEFQGDIAVDAAYASAAATAGVYKTILVRQPNEEEGSSNPVIPYATGTPTPYTGANVTFTISPDLQSVNFGGKILPLIGDSRPTSISYSNAVTSGTNKVTVIFFLNGSKHVYSVFAEYNQFGVSGRTPYVRVSNYLSRDNTVTVKQ